MKLNPFALALPLLTLALTAAPCRAAVPAGDGRTGTGGNPYFAIEVVDEASGRGVPLVELRTTNEIRYYTDSAGLVAFNEPGLMGREVFFSVSSPGYEFPADGFGMRGARLTPVPGGSARLKIKRTTNVAERLYRVTGQGIYADSVLLGRPVPLAEPVLNGLVTGQDSAYAEPYRGKIYWFWGDTNRPSYPLGNFAMSGATSELPGKGGLHPDQGVNLRYWVDENGFSRGMAPLPRPGLVWVDGICVVKGDGGEDRMIGSFDRLRTLGEVLERGFVAWDDASETFKHLSTLDLNDSAIRPRGHPLYVTVDGTRYVYFTFPYPLLRVRADWKHATDPKAYEAFTCLKPGARYDKSSPALDRDAEGKLVYGWKDNTDPVGPAEQKELVGRGFIKPDEGWLQLRDAESGGRVTAHAGSVAWNDYRKRYVMLFTEIGDKPSHLGEVWYAEADAPEGPWRRARKVATHPNYSFYNTVHHPFFDQHGGRVIYFQGTYVTTFSDNPHPTPRYDYNQLMYRLDLSDPRLAMKGE